VNPAEIRILVVDDDRPILELLGEYLATRGHPVVTAETGEQARTLLARESFNVVLTDIKMPGLDGLQLLDHIQESSPGTAVILMTGYGTIESAIRAMKRGALDYLQKPFKLRDVYATIEAAVSRTVHQQAAMGAQTLSRLQQAATAMEGPEHLMGFYEALGTYVALEFENSAVMVSFREPERSAWVPYQCTDYSGFQGFDLEAAGAIIRERSLTSLPADCWVGTQVGETLLTEIPIRVDLSGPNRPCGLLAVARAPAADDASTELIQICASVAGDAISREFLKARLQDAQNQPQTLLPQTRPDQPHAARVESLAMALAEQLGMSTAEQQTIRWSARLQGKVPTFTESVHGVGIDIMTIGGGGLPIATVGALEPVLLAREERFDGTGTPHGLAGDEIPREAQAVALATWWDHRTVSRRFAPRLSRGEAAEALSRESGRAFSPEVVKALGEVLKKS
jgi:response regulator RpfG family c-di-GMP phosphodiesterase